MSGSNNEIANTGGPASSAEPSMEEILASIRRILKDDQTSVTPDPEEAEDEVFVLDSTMVVKPGTGVVREVEPVLVEPISVVESLPEPLIAESALEPEFDAPSDDDANLYQPHLSSELPPPAMVDFEVPPATGSLDLPPHETPVLEAASLEFQAEKSVPDAMEEYNMSDDIHENVQPPHGLVSDSASDAAVGSIGALIRSISSERSIAVGRPGLTLEDLVREELRPLLKSWLDSHLPMLVERIVRAEIQRVVERSGV